MAALRVLPRYTATALPFTVCFAALGVCVAAGIAPTLLVDRGFLSAAAVECPTCVRGLAGAVP